MRINEDMEVLEVILKNGGTMENKVEGISSEHKAPTVVFDFFNFYFIINSGCYFWPHQPVYVSLTTLLLQDFDDLPSFLFPVG